MFIMFIDGLRQRRRELFCIMYDRERRGYSIPMHLKSEMRQIVNTLNDLGEPFYY
jgi:hypothetical protein